MATILEGLNQISEKLGGASDAEQTLEALNAISGALGGETDAENNADAIANIAVNAAGGGGGASDLSLATVTVTWTFAPLSQSGNMSFGLIIPSVKNQNGAEYMSQRSTITAYINANETTSVTAEFMVPLYKGKFLSSGRFKWFDDGFGFDMSETEDPTATGGVAVDNSPMIGTVTITGDGTLTIPVVRSEIS